MLEKLHIYYTNDLHSHFAQWPRVVGYLKEKKKLAEYQGRTCWLADIGDHMDRVHPISEAFLGKANVSLLNEAGYDFATFGNNEGITLAHEDLFQLYDQAAFDVVCANMQGGKIPEWLHASVIKSSKSGIKIGVIGLTAPFNDYYDLLGWHMDAPWEALAAHLPALRQEADVVLLLSHLGISEDREIARRFPEIDVIIGSHTHHLLETGEYENNAVITAAGKYCTHVGEVVLTWDHQSQKLIEKEAFAIDITDYPKDPETDEKLMELEKKANEVLHKKIAHLDVSLEVDWFQRTELIQRLTDTVLEWTKADCAMLNTGLLLDGLPAGDITYKDVHRICPHPINPCVVDLTGSELLEVIRESMSKAFTHFQLRGFGFRGKVLGEMIYSNLQIKTGKHQNGQSYVKEVHIAGNPLHMENTYHVATADTFTFGSMLPEIAKASVKRYFVPELLRDLLAETVRRETASGTWK